MSKAKPLEAPVEHDRLGECINELRDEVRVLRDAIDELRSELQWIANNPEPAGESSNGTFIVKQMAADPCAKDWAKRLVVERGEAVVASFNASDPVVVEHLKDATQPEDGTPVVKPFGDAREQSRLF
jgi:hypothetical protein